MAVLVQVGGVAAGLDEQGRLLVLEETPLADEQVTVSTTVVGLNPPPNANVALIQALTNPIRFKANGDSPAAAEGLRMAPNDVIRLEGFKTLHGFRAIREGAADATVEAHYFTQELGLPPR